MMTLVVFEGQSRKIRRSNIFQRELGDISYVYDKLTYTPRRTRGDTSRLLSLSTPLSDEVATTSKKQPFCQKNHIRNKVFPLNNRGMRRIHLIIMGMSNSKHELSNAMILLTVLLLPTAWRKERDL